MSQKRKITDKNLYELLEVLSSATEQELKKAYRKKALKCHPDKNPDNPKAAELFHELSEALEILTDEKARTAYDRTLKAKEQAKERLRELDSKRRKFKEDLERREQAAKEDSIARAAANRYSTVKLSEEESFQKEVDRLRKDGSRALREEQEMIRQQILKDQQGKFSFLSPTDKPTVESEGPRIKVKWAKFDNPKGYSDLMQTFSKYGKVTSLVVGKKMAIIEFDNQMEADIAFAKESSNISSGLQLEWLSKPKPVEKPCKSEHSSVPTQPPSVFPTTASSNLSSQPISSSGSSFADFEAMILGKLSAAAEAQKQNSSV